MKKLRISYDVTAIICHHKGTLVDKAIESLQNQREVNVDIIVVTTGQENVDRLKEKYPLIFVLDVEGGPAKKRNVGVHFARSELIAFFDDDIVAFPYAVFYMCQSLERESVGAVFGRLMNMEYTNRFDEAGSFLTWSGFLYARCESGIEDKGQFDKECPILAGKSASMMVKRSVFLNVGGFDELYGILGEETDLAWRIWLRGHSVMWCPKSRTLHAFNTRFKPADFYTPARVYLNGCRNYLMMLVADLEIKNLIIPFLVQTLVWVSAAVGFFITGKFEASKNIFKGLYGFIKNLRATMRKRFVVQRMRVISDRDLLPLVSHNPSITYYLKRFVHYIYTGRHG
jgi:GT2 family glycosyltransferase